MLYPFYKTSLVASAVVCTCSGFALGYHVGRSTHSPLFDPDQNHKKNTIIKHVVETKSKCAANGWGNRIQWYSFKEGQQTAKELNKPAMIVIHTVGPVCEGLRKHFASSPDIEQLSRSFVMINIEDNGDPDYPNPDLAAPAPDGKYVPRIMFTDAEGKVIKEVTNGNPTHVYAYHDVTSVCDVMRRVQRLFKKCTQ